MHGFSALGSNVPDGILAPEVRFGRLLPNLSPRALTEEALADTMGAANSPMDAGAAALLQELVGKGRRLAASYHG